MKKKNIGVNAILNVIKSGLSVLFPLITYPYALRILGADGIGKVTYGQSIVSYFSLFALLGAATYGVREGAKRKKDAGEFQRFVNEVFTINVFTTTVSYFLLISILLFIPKFQDYRFLIILESLSIAFTTMGLDWINTVYEDFLLLTVRSIVTHIISLVLLFVLVRTPDDFYWYAFLTVLTNGIVCVSNWFYIRKYVKPRILLSSKLKTHVKPLLLLFSNAVAVSIYVNFDTTMLGWMKGDYAVGLYAGAVKIYTIVKSIMQAIYAVTIPRLSAYIGEARQKDYKTLYTEIWGYMALILIPAGVGLCGISREVMLIMGGAEYENAAVTLQILSMSLIFAIFGGLVTGVLNITIGKEKDNLIATVLSALINCGLNLVFIPLFSQNGAAFTTLLSELFVFVFCILRVPERSRYLDKKDVVRSLRDACLGCLGILGYVLLVKSFVVNTAGRVILIIPGSVIIYGTIVMAAKNPHACKCLELLRKKMRRT